MAPHYANGTSGGANGDRSGTVEGYPIVRIRSPSEPPHKKFGRFYEQAKAFVSQHMDKIEGVADAEEVIRALSRGSIHPQKLSSTAAWKRIRGVVMNIEGYLTCGAYGGICAANGYAHTRTKCPPLPNSLDLLCLWLLGTVEERETWPGTLGRMVQRCGLDVLIRPRGTRVWNLEIWGPVIPYLRDGLNMDPNQHQTVRGMLLGIVERHRGEDVKPNEELVMRWWVAEYRGISPDQRMESPPVQEERETNNDNSNSNGNGKGSGRGRNGGNGGNGGSGRNGGYGGYGGNGPNNPVEANGVARPRQDDLPAEPMVLDSIENDGYVEQAFQPVLPAATTSSNAIVTDAPPSNHAVQIRQETQEQKARVNRAQQQGFQEANESQAKPDTRVENGAQQQNAMMSTVATKQEHRDTVMKLEAMLKDLELRETEHRNQQAEKIGRMEIDIKILKLHAAARESQQDARLMELKTEIEILKLKFRD